MPWPFLNSWAVFAPLDWSCFKSIKAFLDLHAFAANSEQPCRPVRLKGHLYDLMPVAFCERETLLRIFCQRLAARLGRA